MCMKILKSVAFPVPEIIGVPEKIGRSLDTPTLPFFQIFSWAFIRMDSINVPANLKSVASPVPEIITIEVLGGSCESPILGNRRL